MYAKKLCKLCGESFIPASGKSLYCNKPIKKICPVCGQQFTAVCNPKSPTTCSNSECRKRAGYVASVKPTQRICRVCGKPFTPTTTNQKDCGQPIVKHCIICGKEFTVICGLYQATTTCGDPSCMRQAAANNTKLHYASEVRKCILCGNDFTPVNNTQRVCSNAHYRNCEICGKSFEIHWKSGMHLLDIPKTCSPECRIKATFADGNPMHNPECREKAKQTLLSRYGVSHPMQSDEIKARADNTSIIKYGKKRFTQTDEYIKKAVKTNQQKYGKDWAMQTAEVKQKAEATLQKNYGVLNPGCSPEIQKRMSAAYKAATGYDNPCQNPEVRERMEQTNLERYGYRHAIQNPEIRDKAKATLLERYGVCNPLQSDVIKQKVQHTNELKYGYTNPAKSPEVQAKIVHTMMSRYGVSHYNESWDYRKSVMTNPEKVENWKSFLSDPEHYIAEHFDTKPNYHELEQELGVDATSIGMHLARANKSEIVQYTISYAENELIDILHTIDPNMRIERHNRSIISPYEIDVYLPDYKLGIEMNPTGTHNSSVGAFGHEVTPPSYHRMKTDLCAQHGILLFHIFGYEWAHKKEIIISMLRNLTGHNEMKVYARNCKVMPVDAKTAYKFLQENHRQGGVHSKYRYGLYHEGELVSLMTFGYMRNTLGIGNEDISDCMELVRFCNKLNTSVIGGASKLFKHFVVDHNPTRIRSFSDRAHTRGSLYTTLGFKSIAQNKESYVWVNSLDNKAYSRVVAQKHNIRKFFKDPTIDINKTEREIMESHGYVRVYDSGTITWEWKSQ